MPVSRYGGYSAAAAVYGTSYRRAATPLPEDGAATYKYLSRANDYYMPDYKFSKRTTVNTEDLDLNKAEEEPKREHAIPGEIRRDTADAVRGRDVIRIVTTRQKKQDEEELTLGQRLAMKHLLLDPKEKNENRFNNRPVRKSSLAHFVPPAQIKKPSALLIAPTVEDEDSDDWTWETCSSDEEGPDVRYFPPTPSPKATPTPSPKATPTKQTAYSRSKTSNLESLSRSEAKSSRQSLDRWTRALFSESRAAKGKAASAASTTSTTSESPSFAKAYRYKPNEKSTFSSDEDEKGDEVNRGWRRGQPPRSDVVVKLVKNEAALTNKILTSTSTLTSKPPLEAMPVECVSVKKEPAKEVKVEVNVVQEPKNVVKAEMRFEVVGLPKVATEEKKLTSNVVVVEEKKKSPRKLAQSEVVNKIEPLVATRFAVKKISAIAETTAIEKAVEKKAQIEEKVDEGRVRDIKKVVIEKKAVKVESKDSKSTNEIEVKEKSSPSDLERLSKVKTTASNDLEKSSEAKYTTSHDLEGHKKTTSNDLEGHKKTTSKDLEGHRKTTSKDLEGPKKTTSNDLEVQESDEMKKNTKPQTDLDLESLTSSQLERLPSPMRKFFEIKSKVAAGEIYIPEAPKGDLPKYWQNTPPSADSASTIASTSMAAMRSEAKRHQAAVRAEQEALLKTSSATDEVEEPWYEDEDEDMKTRLKTFEHRPSDHHRNEADKRTPEENVAIIKLYGGVQFPGGKLDISPMRILKKIASRAKRRKKTNEEEEKASSSASTSSTASSDSFACDNNVCDTNCHKKCEKNIPNLCGIDQEMLSDTLQALKKDREHKQGAIADIAEEDENEAEEEVNASSSESDSDEDGASASAAPKRNEKRLHHPASAAAVKVRPPFRKYGVDDFSFLKVLGKGSFGKVLLAELRASSSTSTSPSYYAVKCLKKDVVLEDDDIECTMIERKVLALGCKHPFLCHLFCTFQTNSHLFFVMEYLNGGDLMFHIQQSGRFEADRARFYAAEIFTALKFLHRKGIVYRDLKLDNLLLDYEGHIRIADFGMCKLQIYLDKTADTFCGTPDYMAPEIIKGLKYTYCVDWWSFGVLLYEMLIGQSPFNGCDEDELFWSICNEQPYFPRFLSREAKHILQLLLEKDPSKRLGVTSAASGDVADQPFFKSIDFARLEKKEIVPPYRPKLRHALDVSFFDEAFTREVAKLTPVNKEFLASVNQKQFKGFSYTNPNYTSK